MGKYFVDLGAGALIGIVSFVAAMLATLAFSNEFVYFAWVLAILNIIGIISYAASSYYKRRHLGMTVLVKVFSVAIFVCGIIVIDFALVSLMLAASMPGWFNRL